MSKPAPTKVSLLLSLISFAIYLPIISSVEIDIFFNPFSLSLFAMNIFNLSPLDKTFFYCQRLLNHMIA